MMDNLSLQYLEAMGIDVYQVRADEDAGAGAASQPLIELGDGDGDIICIVANREQAGLKLAAGIGGAMRCTPIWAWPVNSDDESAGGQSLANVVSEKLSTRILVFGESLAEQVLGVTAGSVISAARVHVVPSLEEVGQDQQAKRALWKLMLDNGIAAPANPARAEK